MRKTMRTRLGIQGLGVFIVLFLPTAWLSAGDITGTMAVPKPDQAVVYVEKAPGTFPAERAVMDQKNKVFIPYVLPVTLARLWSSATATRCSTTFSAWARRSST